MADEVIASPKIELRAAKDQLKKDFAEAAAAAKTGGEACAKAFGDGIQTTTKAEKSLESLHKRLRDLGQELTGDKATAKLRELELSLGLLGGAANAGSVRIEHLQRALAQLSTTNLGRLRAQIEGLKGQGGAVSPGLAGLLDATAQTQILKAVVPPVAAPTASMKALSALMKEGEAAAEGAAAKLGSVSTVLSAMGPVGMAAAAGIGVATAEILLIEKAVSSAIGTLVDWSKRGLESAEKVENLSTQLSIGTEEFQRWQAATANANVADETFAQNAGAMLERIASGGAEVEGALERMGLQLDQVRKLSPEQQLLTLLTALRQIANPGNQADIAKALGAKSPEMLRLIRSNFFEARDAAQIFTKDTIAAQAELNNKLSAVSAAWEKFKSAATSGLTTSPAARQALDDVATALGRVTAALIAAAPHVAKFLDATAGRMVRGAERVASGAARVAGWVGVDLSGPEPGRAVASGSSGGGLAPAKTGDQPAETAAERTKRLEEARKSAAAATKALADLERQLNEERARFLPPLEQEILKIQAAAQAKRDEAKAALEDAKAKAAELSKTNPSAGSAALSAAQGQYGATVGKVNAIEQRQIENAQRKEALDLAERQRAAAQAQAEAEAQLLPPLEREVRLAEIAAKAADDKAKADKEGGKISAEAASISSKEASDKAARSAWTAMVGEELALTEERAAAEARLTQERIKALPVEKQAAASIEAEYRAQVKQIDIAETAGKMLGEMADQKRKEALDTRNLATANLAADQAGGGLVKRVQQEADAVRLNNAALAYLRENKQDLIDKMILEGMTRDQAIKKLKEEEEQLKKNAGSSSTFMASLTSLSRVFELLGDAGGGAFAKIGAAVSAAIPQLKDLYKQIDAATSAAAAAGPVAAAGAALFGLGQAIGKAIGGEPETQDQKAGDAAAGYGMMFSQRFNQAVADEWSNWGNDYYTTLMTMLPELADEWGTSLSSMGDWTTEYFDNVLNSSAKQQEQLSEIFGRLEEEVGLGLPGALEALDQATTNTWAAMADGTITSREGLKQLEGVWASLEEQIAQGNTAAVEQMGGLIDETLSAYADGTITAQEATSDLGDAFNTLGEAAENGVAGARAEMLEMIRDARAAGTEVPEIAAAIEANLQDAAQNLGKLPPIVTQEDAQSQAQLFADTWAATVAEVGTYQAAQQMKPAWEELQKQLAAGGFDVSAITGPMSGIMDAATSETLGPVMEGIGALQSVVSDLADSDYMTAGSLSAAEQQVASSRARLIAGGMSEADANSVIAPMLADLQQAADDYGLTLSADTQQLLASAGIVTAGDATQTTANAITGDVVPALWELVELQGGTRPALDAINASLSAPAGASSGQAMLDSLQATPAPSGSMAALLESSAGAVAIPGMPTFSTPSAAAASIMDAAAAAKVELSDSLVSKLGAQVNVTLPSAPVSFSGPVSKDGESWVRDVMTEAYRNNTDQLVSSVTRALQEAGVVTR